MPTKNLGAEAKRLSENYQENKPWLKWGPYLSERQWGTVREDYSPDGEAWDFFPHDHARSRVYRWGEDGIAGISDNLCNLCFALTLWNGKDPFLKERLFGLNGKEGNHAEDCKELYYYLDSTPTHSYMKHLYKYPQNAFPYEELLAENRRRNKTSPEFEILDTGVFENNKYFDVFTEYAKNEEEDILIKITVHNRGEAPAEITVLPTLWFRNRWDFIEEAEKPRINQFDKQTVIAKQEQFGTYFFYFKDAQQLLFTENETNLNRFGWGESSPFVKDTFHTTVVNRDFSILEEKFNGTKFSPFYEFQIDGGGHQTILLRLSSKAQPDPFSEFEAIFNQRKREANEFYATLQAKVESEDLKNIQRQAFAGMLWSKQYYNIDIEYWLDGDPGHPQPPESRKRGRNSDWRTLNNEDIISMPDKWEYPWYAVWDLAFHCVPLAQLDVEFAKNQILLFLWEWYMKPNGQIPAYEWNFGDVNPPVHAWAAKKVYDMEKEKKDGKGDITFLKRVFQKLLLNFTWWVNKKDANGNNIFEGGFLGLDNIGLFDRSQPIPGGGILEQADGTSWMAMYSLNMLEIALEIALVDPAYEDMATKFLEHFIYITESLNTIDRNSPSAWDDGSDFFYDLMLFPDGRSEPIKVRSLVGLTTLFGVAIIKKETLKKLPDFHGRLEWFRKYRRQLDKYKVIDEYNGCDDILLSLVSKERLRHIMESLLDEKEFLSPVGIRSMSKVHETPYRMNINGQNFEIKYTPAESDVYLFGGNSNWRGPIWFPMNYLIIESLRKYHLHYLKCEDLLVECPTGSGNWVDLNTVTEIIEKRLISIFTLNETGQRAVNDHYEIYRDPHFKDLILFFEYFHGDNGRGVGASHQTGWTGLVAQLIEEVSS